MGKKPNKNTKLKSIEQIISEGASVDIHFHDCGDLQSAYNKLKPYTDVNSITKHERDGTVWLNIETEKVSIVAFL